MAGFFEMGGYAPYVWGSYGLTVLVLAALIYLSIRRLRAAERMLSLLQQSRRSGGNDGSDA